MAGNENDVSETPSLLNLYKQFGDSTSMHGIGRVINNNSRWKRTVWSVMFLIGVAFAIYQFLLTMNDFYTYPVTTEVILQHENRAKFPGVTFCNLNMMRKSMIDKDIQDMLETFDKPGGSTADDIRQMLIYNNTKTDDDESAHQISDMLITCTFKTNPCTKANFTRINTVSFGACYTYNIDDNELNQYTTSAGPENGLILELNIEKDEYLPINSKVGAKVIVHPYDDYSFPEDGGILAHPGALTNIQVKKAVTHGLPAPYSNCVGDSGYSSSQRNLFPNKKYMQKTCMKSCYQLALYQKCKCCDPTVPCDYYNILNVDKITTNITVPKLKLCEPSADVVCSASVEASFLKGGQKCDERCPPTCDRTTFDTVVSSALWPAESRFNVFLELLNRGSVLQNKSFADNASLELYVRSNFLRIEIFLDRLDFLEYTAQAKYDWNLLLGTIGGLLGLWLGFSLLTAMEIVEVLFDTVLYYVRRKHKEKMTKQTEQN